MSTEHLIRTVAVLVAFLITLVGYIYLAVLDIAPAVAGRLEGMLAILIPAVLDTIRVGGREKRTQLPPTPPEKSETESIDS